jgi:hypothetical protein
LTGRRERGFSAHADRRGDRSVAPLYIVLIAIFNREIVLRADSMPSTNRRTVLAGLSGAVAAVSGCAARGSSATPAHWVTVYLGDRDGAHDVTVTVENSSGDALFEREYRLSDGNEADEDAPFEESTGPETIGVTVDGTRFERDWPGFEQPGLPCDEPNRAGVEIWVESGSDGSPEVRMEASCQHVTME